MNILKNYPNLFFTGDKHLGHLFMVRGMRDEHGKLLPGAKIPRPQFSTIEEHDETIISRHNERVRKGDLVYDQGDMFLKITKDKAWEYRRRLVGNIYAFEGNHDDLAAKLAKEGAFVWFRQLEELNLGQPYFEEKQKIVLCHYAMKVWHGSHKGSYHLYGHSHGMLPEDHTLSFDVGVDSWDFYPVSIEELKAKMALKMPAWLAYKESLKGSGRVE